MLSRPSSALSAILPPCRAVGRLHRTNAVTHIPGCASVALVHTEPHLSPSTSYRPLQAPVDQDFHTISSRHVLRGILRECTYFPDLFAAKWIRKHATSRFRTYDLKNRKNEDDNAYKKRLELVRRKSRQALYQLQRANEGDRKMLLKALSMAYGRTGRRRRELVQSLLFPTLQEEQVEDMGEDTWTEAVAASNRQSPCPASPASRIKDSADGPAKRQVKEAIKNLPAPVRALAQSQIAASPPTLARRNPRRLGIEIPEVNMWLKPMPQARIKNKLQEWYASLLDSLQPPLPDAQWRGLRDLALGTSQGRLAVPRRKQLSSPPSALEMVVMHGKLPATVFRKDHAHRITPRFMRRLWADVFSQCPLMEYDPALDRWNVIWGHHVLKNGAAKEVQEVAAAPVRSMDLNTEPNPVADHQNTSAL